MIDLYTERSGRGTPIVCLHGFGASTYTWRWLAPALARDHEVVLVDLKGFGRSPKPRDNDYSVFTQADLVVALLRRLALRDVTLIGHSYGGAVALAVTLALQGTEAPIERLVLVDTIAYRQPLPWFIRVLRLPVVGALAPWLLPAEAQVRLVLREAYHDPRRIAPETVGAYAAGLESPGGRYAACRVARDLIPAAIDEFTTRYASIRIPALVIRGEHDRIVPRDVTETLAHALPASRLVVVPGTGHVPNEEDPPAVMAALGAFL